MVAKTLNDYMTELLSKVTHTVNNYEVKELKWNDRDNIIIGRVKDPITGRPDLHDGWVTVQFKKNGTATNKWKGRDDLNLKLR
jgi:hypothetical protein